MHTRSPFPMPLGCKALANLQTRSCKFLYVICTAHWLESFGSQLIAGLSPPLVSCRSIQYRVMLSFPPSIHLISPLLKSHFRTWSHFFLQTKCSSATSPQKLSGSRTDFL